jgi:lipoprotein NlpI
LKWLSSVRAYLADLQPKPYDPFPAYKERIAVDHVRRGNELLQEGRYDRAIEAYNEAIQFKPDLAMAFCNRSCAHLEKAEYDLAIQDCDRAISRDPDYPHSFCNRGTAHLGKGDREQAIRDYDRAISLKADFAIAMSNRGFALFSAGEADRASVDFDRAIELDPGLALAFRTRGAAAFCNRRFAQARKDCAEAARLDPKDCNSLLWLYLANARDGLINQTHFEEQAAGRDLAKWPGPAFEFLLGSLTRDALLADSNDENPYKEREQRCAAHFAIGQAELLNGHLAEGADSFRNAISSGATNCIEYVAAEIELQELK